MRLNFKRVYKNSTSGKSSGDYSGDGISSFDSDCCKKEWYDAPKKQDDHFDYTRKNSLDEE